jgi:N6-adenosine-specific RNA methylase IME4
MIPLPDKKYSIIYADPPWSYQNRGTRAAASKHYDTMTIEDIKRMGVGAAGGGIANEDCVLFMWATFPMLREALDVIEAWGFSYKTVAFNWVKQNRAQDHPHHRADPGRRAPHHRRLRDGQVYARSHQPRRHGPLCHL